MMTHLKQQKLLDFYVNTCWFCSRIPQNCIMYRNWPCGKNYRNREKESRAYI